MNNQNDETYLNENKNSTNKRSGNDVKKLEVKGKNSLISNIIGGGVGGAAGVMGATAMMGFTTQEDIEATAASETQEYTPDSSEVNSSFNGGQIIRSHNINDNMSFNEAFASARNDVGAGGVFYWKGGWYGTYYANEWHELSPEFKEQFSNFPYESLNDFSSNDIIDSPSVVHDQPITSPTTQEVGISVEINQPIAEEDIEILLPDIQYGEIEGQTVAYMSTQIEGANSVFIDIDTDGIFDIVAIDTGNETPDFYEINISYEEAIEHQHQQENYLEVNNLPDYSNDGNVSDFTA